MKNQYVHGYNEFETTRLNDQASTLNSILHHDSIYRRYSKVLEIGCGVGAQTEILCRNNPDIRLTSIDISAESIKIAEKRCHNLGIGNVEFIQADIFNLPFDKNSFDHVFICFVLEHLTDPVKALLNIKPILKSSGSLTVIEGDHGSAYFHPDSKYAQATIDCLVKLQAMKGGNSLIGRTLYPLLRKTGFSNISVSPRMIYADAGRPEMVDGFTKKTFIAMVEGIKNDAIKEKFIDEKTWKRGISELKESSKDTGTFCYTFFKAVAYK